MMGVLNSIYRNPHSSIRTAAAETGLSRTTTHRIAHELQLRPYRLGLAQKLSEYDKIVRVDAAQQMLPVIENGNDLLFIYTDEATYRTDGHVNRWN